MNAVLEHRTFSVAKRSCHHGMHEDVTEKERNLLLCIVEILQKRGFLETWLDLTEIQYICKREKVEYLVGEIDFMDLSNLFYRLFGTAESYEAKEYSISRMDREFTSFGSNP